MVTGTWTISPNPQAAEIKGLTLGVVSSSVVGKEGEALSGKKQHPEILEAPIYQGHPPALANHVWQRGRAI